MDMHELTRELKVASDSKIVMLVADGLGGLPLEPGGKTELETARTPNLDELARRGISGASIPVKPGITPGSGPGHLGLFGYDPLEVSHRPRRARGHGHRLRAGPARRRGPRQLLHARRPGPHRRPPRGPDHQRRQRPAGRRAGQGANSRRRSIRRAGQGASLRGRVSRSGARRGRTRHRSASHRRAAARAQGHERREPEDGRSRRRVHRSGPENSWPVTSKANGLTLRGFSAKPKLPSYEDVYGLKAAAIAVYPMYKGLARLVGMTIVGKAATLGQQIDVLEALVERLRFLFHPLQVHRQHGRRRQLRGQGEADRRARRVTFPASPP